MFDAKTDHKIEPYGANVMKLKEFDADIDIIVATRQDVGQPWTIHSDKDDVADTTADNREDAIQEMVNLALVALPGTGYSCIVPHDLPETP